MKTNHSKIDQILNLGMKLIGVVVAFTTVIAGFYSWLIPRFFDGFKTYSVLVIGVCGSAIMGIACCIKADRSIIGKKYEYLILILSGVGVAVLVLYFSMLIILNTRGS